MRKNHYRIFAFVMAAALALSAWGFAAAQDAESQPFLGIGLSEAENGVLVQEVVPSSPAAEAGLEVGDLITTLNGETVTAENIREALADFAVGDSVELGVQRGDETLSLEATLAERPAEENQPFDFELNTPFMPGRPLLGVTLDDAENGAVITAVTPDSPAAEAGLQEGDVIVRIGETDIANAQEAVDAVRQHEAGDTVTIEVQREGETLNVDATLEAMAAPQIPFEGDFVAYNGQGWQIFGLSEDSALAAAGLQAGDVITAFDGSAYDPQALAEYLKGLADDAQVTLTVERSGESTEITAPAADLSVLTEMGLSFNFGEGMPFGQFGGMMGGRLGVAFVTLDEQVAQEHNIDQTEGALVTEVAADTPAAEAGVQVDDIITAVNDEPVNAEFTLRDRLIAYEAGDVVSLTILRGSETLNVDATLAEPELPFNGQNFQFFGPDGLELPFGMRPGRPGQPDAAQPNM